MKFLLTAIPDIILIKPELFSDDRGFFMETRHDKKFAQAGIAANFVQDNYSCSVQGVLRGLHYQIKQPQGKLIRALSGEIFDVAVDLRKNSPTFGQWIGAILSEENKHALWVPAGFAHGFYVLSDKANVLYSCTDFYAPQFDRTLIWNDVDIDVKWPVIPGITMQISYKDAVGKTFKEIEYFE